MVNARAGDCYVVDHCDVRLGRDNTGVVPNDRVYPTGQRGYKRHIVDTGVGKLSDNNNAIRSMLVNVLKFFGQPSMETTNGSISMPDGNAACVVDVFQVSRRWLPSVSGLCGK
jgi:hypothetical protein